MFVRSTVSIVSKTTMRWKIDRRKTENTKLRESVGDNSSFLFLLRYYLSIHLNLNLWLISCDM